LASREAQARRAVAAQLGRMSDTQLADLGFTPVEALYVRTNGRVPPSFWA
jgi:uncharacterized protein YjiS (DUF1127 family)